MVVCKLGVARRYCQRLVNLGSNHLSIDSSTCCHEQLVHLPQIETLFRHSRIASTIRGTATTIEKSCLMEAELSGVGVESNDRHTARIRRSFKVVSLAAVPPLGRHLISTQLQWLRKTCRTNPLSLAKKEGRRTQVCCLQVQISEFSNRIVIASLQSHCGFAFSSSVYRSRAWGYSVKTRRLETFLPIYPSVFNTI